MKNSSDQRSTREASARRIDVRRAAGLILVALLVLGGTSLVLEAINSHTRPAGPPQPPPEAAPPWSGQGRGGERDPSWLAEMQDAPIEELIERFEKAEPPDRADAANEEETVPEATEATEEEGETPDAADDEATKDKATAAGAATASMARSEPTKVRIPKINVDAEIMNLGLDEEGMLEVPPLEDGHLAGWYELGPSPGEVGNSVVVGHVDSRTHGPAVFFELGALRPGDQVEIDRADGSVARFTVEGVESHPKAEFPTDLVYGPTDEVSLRLITCGGEFDDDAREYLDNIIVFATFDGDAGG